MKKRELNYTANQLNKLKSATSASSLINAISGKGVRRARKE